MTGKVPDSTWTSKAELTDKIDFLKSINGLKQPPRQEESRRPKTPDFFWELEFPDTEDCIYRGYLDAEPEAYRLKKINKYLETKVDTMSVKRQGSPCVEEEDDSCKRCRGSGILSPQLHSALDAELQRLVLKCDKTTPVIDMSTRILMGVLEWAGMSLQSEVRGMVTSKVPVSDWAKVRLYEISSNKSLHWCFDTDSKLYDRELIKRYLHASYRMATKQDPKTIDRLDAILAVDGTSHFDGKRYVDNLRFDETGELKSWWCIDQEEHDWRAHVLAVRKMYEELKNSGVDIVGGDGKYAVYLAIRKAYEGLVDMKELSESKTFDSQILQRLSDIYVRSVKIDVMNRLAEKFPKTVLQLKNVEDEENGRKSGEE